MKKKKKKREKWVKEGEGENSGAFGVHVEGEWSNTVDFYVDGAHYSSIFVNQKRNLTSTLSLFKHLIFCVCFEFIDMYFCFFWVCSGVREDLSVEIEWE